MLQTMNLPWKLGIRPKLHYRISPLILLTCLQNNLQTLEISSQTLKIPLI